MKFVYLIKLVIFASTVTSLLTWVPFSINQISAIHSDCWNWKGLQDTDCDGLADQWEDDHSYPVDVNGNQVTVSLPQGISKYHRDILVEIDYMSHHIPPASAIESVVDRFNDFELLNPNPDNTYGVNLHYIIDNNVPHLDCIDVFTESVPDPAIDSFDEYKQNYMGTEGERIANPDFYLAKKDVFHYALFIHTRCGSLSNQQSSGAAEGPGNDLVVSLGYPGWGNIIDGHHTGSNEYKASTFMHELGHNLGLRHAGSTDVPHCKPNYLSVMNYAFQFPTILTGSNWNMDYSHNVLNSLKENGLAEPAGIGLAQPSTLKTSIGHSTWPHSGGIPHTPSPPPTANSSPINYNWYKGSSSSNEPSVISSITNFHFYPCNDDDVSNTQVGGKLFGYDDIHYSSLVFWSTEGTFQNGTIIGIGSGSGLSGKISQIDSNDNKAESDPNSNISNQSVLQSNNSLDILNDTLSPPCEISDPNCHDLPCDREDPFCAPKTNHNFTDPNAATYDVGNRTEIEEITLSSVMEIINTKVFGLNEYIQNLTETQFVNGTDVPKLQMDLANSLINDDDSVLNLLNSSKSQQALGKLYNLRSMVDGLGHNDVILPPWSGIVLDKTDDLIFAIRSKE